MIRLQCLQGPHAEKTFEFESESIVLGRGPDCDLRVDDGACSRHHAKIELEDGEYWLSDLRSTNGVLVNGKKIEQCAVTYGDRVAFGRNIFVFLTDIPKPGEDTTLGDEPFIQNTVTSKEAETRFRELTNRDSDPESEGVISRRALEEIRRRNRQMHVLHSLSLAINKTLELEDLHTFLAESIFDNFKDAERVSIYMKSRGKDSSTLEEVKSLCRGDNKELPVSRSLLERVEEEQVAILATDASVDGRFSESESVAISNLRSLMCVPLVRHEKFLGVIYVENCTRASCFTREDLELLTVAGNQAAVAVENASLYEELQYSFYDTVRSLCNAIEAKDRYTRGHSARVAHYAVGIGKELGLSTRRISLLRIAAELHDIGKIAIKEDIIGKAGKLTDEEHKIVKQHPQLGINILKPIRLLEPVLPFILHHHERLNGEGYPDGLAGEEIPLEARILNLADAFDAMTTQRPYNRPISHAEAFEQCRKEAGISFDGACVKALKDFLTRKGNETFIATQQFPSRRESLQAGIADDTDTETPEYDSDRTVSTSS